MTQTIIDISATLVLYYDENSPEFKEALESYLEVIDSRATKDDMLKQVAWCIIEYGDHRMIEGVGYVAPHRQQAKEPDSGIRYSYNHNAYEFDIWSHKKVEDEKH